MLLTEGTEWGGERCETEGQIFLKMAYETLGLKKKFQRFPKIFSKISETFLD